MALTAVEEEACGDAAGEPHQGDDAPRPPHVVAIQIQRPINKSFIQGGGNPRLIPDLLIGFIIPGNRAKVQAAVGG